MGSERITVPVCLRFAFFRTMWFPRFRPKPTCLLPTCLIPTVPSQGQTAGAAYARVALTACDATAPAAVARRRRAWAARSCCASFIQTVSQRRTGSACRPATSRTPRGRCCWRCTAGACHTSPSRAGTNTGARTATSSSHRRASRTAAWARAGTAPAASVPQARAEPPARARTPRQVSATRRAASAATAAGGRLASTRSVRSRRCSMRSWETGAHTAARCQLPLPPPLLPPPPPLPPSTPRGSPATLCPGAIQVHRARRRLRHWSLQRGRIPLRARPR